MEREIIPILRLDSIGKKFPGVRALNDVNFELFKGEICMLIGENGAGKSTLIKILSGAYHASEGRIFFNNRVLEKNDPYIAREIGIFTIYQERSLIPLLSVAENIFLGKEIINSLGIVDYKKQNDLTKKYLANFGYNIDPRTIAEDLSIGESKIVEICKAIRLNVKVLILDEPTAPLSEKDRDNLFEVLKKLKSRGVSIIYISHRLKEVKIIGDRFTVLKDGNHVITKSVKDLKNIDELIFYMTGKDIKLKFPRVIKKVGKKLLRVSNLTKVGSFSGISLEAHAGEIIGIFGLVGCGSEKFGKALFGAGSFDSGEIEIYNDEATINIKKTNPKKSMSKGLNYLPSDKKKDGLVLHLSVKENMSISSLSSFSNFGVINSYKEISKVKEFISLMDIKTPSVHSEVQFLSGGNQQKVLLARALNCESNIFIFNGPTIGIDVGAKREIYNFMNMLTKNGASIIMISYELAEILGMSDKILVMHQGKITGEFHNRKHKIGVSEERILKCAFGESIN